MYHPTPKPRLGHLQELMVARIRISHQRAQIMVFSMSNGPAEDGVHAIRNITVQAQNRCESTPLDIDPAR